MYKIPNKPFLENKEWLVDMYLKKNKSAKSIGAIVVCSKYSVLRALKNFNIPIRVRTNVHNLLVEKEWIKKAYVNDNMSLTQIAKIASSTPGNIWTILRQMGIVTRSYKEGLAARFPQKRMGKNSPAWKGGVTPLNHIIRTSKEYKMWRLAVFERDNYTCQMCKKRGGYLEADHIKQFAHYPELRFSVDNGRTLCKECHKKTPTHSNKSPIDKTHFSQIQSIYE